MISRGPSIPLLAPRDDSARTRSRIDLLTRELSSGRRGDVGRAISSDFSPISTVSHELRVHDAKAVSLSRAGTWLETAQLSLDAVAGAGDRISAELPAALALPGSSSLVNLARSARGVLDDLTTSLNAAQSGRPIFANGDPAGGAPIDLDILLAETTILAQSAGDLNAFLGAFDAYFAGTSGTGIETNVIRSHSSEHVVFPLGKGGSISMPVSLADPGIRDAIKQAAIIAALPSAGFAITDSIRARLSTELPARGAEAAGKLISTRERLGGVEERVSRLSTQLSDERSRLEGRQAKAVASDPYETATQLQNEMTRLETIFAVTARRARLKLSDYVR